jgi:hypothetical protein
VQTWEFYKKYVRSMLNRYNSLTKRRYKDDWAIMTWQIANEPHTSDNFEKAGHDQVYGDRRTRLSRNNVGGLTGNFLCMAAQFLKQEAPKQLVATGADHCHRALAVAVQGTGCSCTGHWLQLASGPAASYCCGCCRHQCGAHTCQVPLAMHLQIATANLEE